MSIDQNENMKNLSIKEVLSRFLAEQSDTITIEEIQDFLFSIQQIMVGIKSLDENRWLSHEQVKVMSSKWSEI